MNNLDCNVLAYRVFDVGPDFDLSKTEKQLAHLAATQRSRLSKPTRSIHIAHAPLSMGMGFQSIDLSSIGQQAVTSDVQVKIWAFGAITVVFNLPLQNTSWTDLVELGTFLESDPQVTDLATEKVRQVLAMLDKSRQPELDVIEDYLIYFFKELPGCSEDALVAIETFDIPKLLLTENSAELSAQVQKMIREGVVQYNKNDLAAITWNSAAIVEPSGSMDVADIIEFALCQVLEMRYYDYVLETKLAGLYNSLEKKTFSIWENQSERLSREAARHYLEISETVENVENSLKVIGDFYLAQIFRTASMRFRFNDWRASVNQKLKNLADISQLISTNINARRGHLLELVIIILIAIEVVPFLWGLLR